MCAEIYEIDPAKFQLSDWHCKQLLKNTGIELDIVTDIDMLLMVEKGIRGGVCNSVHWYTKTNNK